MIQSGNELIIRSVILVRFFFFFFFFFFANTVCIIKKLELLNWSETFLYISLVKKCLFQGKVLFCWKILQV